MLPAKNRLSKKEDIRRVHRSGTPFSFGGIGLKRLKTESENVRVGILVKKSATDKATERNRIKRKLRGILLSNLEKIAVGYDIVIVCSKNINDLKQEEGKNLVETILRRSKLLKIK